MELLEKGGIVNGEILMTGVIEIMARPRGPVPNAAALQYRDTKDIWDHPDLIFLHPTSRQGNLVRLQPSVWYPIPHIIFTEENVMPIL